jgi:hypothetical protein
MKSFEYKFTEFMQGLDDLGWNWEESHVQELYLMCKYLFDPTNPDTVKYNKYIKEKKRNELLAQLRDLDDEI